MGLGFDPLTKPNSIGLQIVWPRTCWAQYLAHPKPKPNLLCTPESPSFTEFTASPIRSLAESIEKFLNSLFLISVCLIKYLCDFIIWFLYYYVGVKLHLICNLIWIDFYLLDLFKKTQKHFLFCKLIYVSIFLNLSTCKYLFTYIYVLFIFISFIFNLYLIYLGINF